MTRDPARALVPFRVLVLGGYGFFGRRLVERLSRRAGLHILVAGRSREQGRRLVERLLPSAVSTLGQETLDVASPDLAHRVAVIAPDVVIHACGPFQGQRYDVALASMAAGAHCIDLADGREFVTGIGRLDEQARAAGVVVLSGASSVPALSSTVADHLAQALTRVDCIDIGISPGNRTERGLSTVQSILSYCGQRLPDQAGERVFGWYGSRRHAYPAPVGNRWLSPCDVPDLELLGGRYAGHPAVHFGAGLEVSLLHFGMNAMALSTRLGLVRDWSNHAVLLKRMADAFKSFGSDAGAMHVALTGLTDQGIVQTRTWHLLATQGDGPYVPTLAASALVRKLSLGERPAPGARPCVGELSLQDFVRECDGLQIEMAELSGSPRP